MKAVVTGASGFVGTNLVRALLDQGVGVVAADIEESDALPDLDVPFAPIDVLDSDSLEKAFTGADVVFHLAAIISIVGDPTGIVRRVNVDGARNASAAAARCGVVRFVHCSSVHSFDLEMCGPSLDEDGPRTIGDRAPAYDRSKYAGEMAVLGAAGDMEVVIANPTGVIGPLDYGPSRMGETIRQFRDRQIPVNIAGGFDFVDVRDVVQGLLLARHKGEPSRNYLLSGTRISITELGQIVATHSSTSTPKLEIPLCLIEPLAPLVMRFTPADDIPLFTPDSLHALRYSPSVSHHRATTELGYSPRPIHETVADTLDWFTEVGM